MQPETNIHPYEDFGTEDHNVINVARTMPDGGGATEPRVYSPDELDAADKSAEQRANELIGDAEMNEIHKQGINNPMSDNPWSHPTSRSGHLFGTALSHKLIFPPKHKLLRVFTGVLFVLFILYAVFVVAR